MNTKIESTTNSTFNIGERWFSRAVTGRCTLLISQLDEVLSTDNASALLSSASIVSVRFSMTSLPHFGDGENFGEKVQSDESFDVNRDNLNVSRFTAVSRPTARSAKHSPIAAEYLNPCPEHGDAMMICGYAGTRSITKW